MRVSEIQWEKRFLEILNFYCSDEFISNFVHLFANGIENRNKFDRTLKTSNFQKPFSPLDF